MLLFFALPCAFAQAKNACSRVATINFQKILVDTNSTLKGEGLRYYLEKDEIAKLYLDQYQESSKVRLENAIMGTVGSGLLITGIMSTSSSKNREALIYGGGAVLLINFLVAKTLEFKNEEKLYKAVEEYNKRNLPRVYFSESEHSTPDQDVLKSFYINKTWSF